MKYICRKCHFIYDEVATKVKFDVLDKDYKCPNCGALKKEFKKDTSNAIWVEKDNPTLCFLEDRCTNCGLCKKVCENTVGIKYERNEVKRPVCINCGQCILNCPFNALDTKLDYKKVLELLQDKNNIVTISIAPAIRTTIGEEFGLPNGSIVTEKLVTALKKAGFTYVFDLTFGADLTVMEEAMELVNRLNNQEKLPLFTSCCPSWVKYCEIYHQDLIDNLSSTKSPIMMQASVINEYFFKNKKDKKIINVMLAPCTAKKMEIKEPNLKGMDFCLTTHEVTLMLKELKIDLTSLEGSLFDEVLPDGSGAGNIFGTSGGVLEATLRTAYYYLTGCDAKEEFLQFQTLRGFEAIREATITILDKTYKVACVYGMPNLEKLLPNSKDYIMIEVMNCPNGCVGGGGQPKTKLPQQKETREARGSSLYQIDNKKEIRFSYKNPDILRLYSNYLNYPNSKIAKKILHTSFKPNNNYFKKREHI